MVALRLPRRPIMFCMEAVWPGFEIDQTQASTVMILRQVSMAELLCWELRSRIWDDNRQPCSRPPEQFKYQEKTPRQHRFLAPFWRSWRNQRPSRPLLVGLLSRRSSIPSCWPRAMLVRSCKSFSTESLQVQPLFPCSCLVICTRWVIWDSFVAQRW